MRRYSPADEERIHLQTRVRDWTRARLLDAGQGASLDAELRVDLRRTGGFLRAGLALFTALIVGAAVGLVVVFLKVSGNGAIGVIAALAALACAAAAEILAGRFRFYRHGVEEMLAAAGVLLLTISAAMLVTAAYGSSHGEAATVAALVTGATAGFAAYRRFGFQYAAIGAMVCAAAIPFQFALGQPLEHLLAAAVLTSAFVAARAKRLRHEADFLGDEYATLQAAAFVGVYLVLNLQVTPMLSGGFVRAGTEPWFKWATYAMTWIIPTVGLRLGIREKDRELVDAGLAAALVTLVTSKPYLGWPRQTWDPILFGVLLIGVAVGVRRWLARGPDGERRGFTPERILESESNALRMAGIVSAALPAASRLPAAVTEPSQFDGGRSGGAGGGAGF